MIPFPSKKYHTIYADPPWNEIGGGRIRRGADRHYNLMRTEDIIRMAPQIKAISEKNCHLYLWVTNNYLIDGLKVLDAWGFTYKTKIVWKKDRFGLGQYFRGITEDCLFGVKGVLPYKEKDGKRQQGVTGFDAPRMKHSQKPEEMRKMIEKVSYPPYIELFARKETPGWDVWGNEVPILDSPPSDSHTETFRDTKDFAGGSGGPNENLPRNDEARRKLIAEACAKLRRNK
jgi:N6-adenosine-specific RNA methylase IME4